MIEHKLFKGEEAPVSTGEYHLARERANHWEQGHQRPRMEMALRFIELAVEQSMEATGTFSLSDLGCGDGGMLAQVVDRWPFAHAWGYDFQPSNVLAAQDERELVVSQLDVFRTHPFAAWRGREDPVVRLGSIVVMTEVLEHLSNPALVLKTLHDCATPQYIIASSPWGEHRDSHDACHAWAFDEEGYERIFTEAGWRIARHERVDWSQVIMVTR